MDLKVPYGSEANKTKAYEGAKKLIPEALAKFGVKADVNCKDPTCSINAKGTGFEAKIHFHDQYAEVSLDLNFLLKPLKNKILEVLEKQIKKVV
jgi:hypothetical protein